GLYPHDVGVSWIQRRNPPRPVLRPGLGLVDADSFHAPSPSARVVCSGRRATDVNERSGGRAGPIRAAVLHLVSTRHAAAAKLIRYQIAKDSSSNATARRKVTGSSTASSLCARRRFWQKRAQL